MNRIGLTDFLSFLDNVIKRPAMYNVQKVEDLDLLLSDYKFASNDDVTNDFLIEFRKFLNLDLSSGGDIDWPHLIRYHAGRNDGNTLKMFEKCLSRFLD